MFGGVEAGGTTFVCAVGTGPGDLHERSVIPTGAPEQTLAAVTDYLGSFELDAVGVACFGPVDLARGRITSTPKPGWAGVGVLATISAALGALPVGFDTDVNGAALGEGRWGAAQGLDTFTYVTVGTGIGGGGMVSGRLMHGLVHPEMGHMRVPRHPSDPLETGSCPFHPDCWEGWAARAAIEKRWGAGVQASDLREGADLELLAHYVAAGIANIVCTLSPQLVILGGGVILGGEHDEGHRELMLAAVRRQVTALLNGYVDADELGPGIGDYIVAPALGDDAGVLGAIVLAERAAAG
ncbi:MAG TPA: ROK family protein [Solirubrobacteraceae bacterium]